MKKYFIIFCALYICFQPFKAKPQNSYFIDGYHGGIWGHYPAGYTTFISDMLDKNQFWKLNLEIEPVTWDNAKKTDASGYERLRTFAKDQSAAGRIEFVNPAYGQAYLFNIQGESVIRQLELGMKKIREHFPEAAFTTYSSEEPCFTSALPQILKSFGYQYASLKNPNTCWGGYTTAFGGELVNWTGPDGSKLLTVPRYASESLLKGSTWQTIAWNNAKEYLEGARLQGIQNPVGMCIQDAGWKNGPWLGQPKNFQYQIWRNYIANIASKENIPDWKFTQENVQVSLVWGSQILQKMAQNTRVAENKLIMAEKINAIQSLYLKQPPRADQFETAWQNLLLAQHHDSWIVPYNVVDKVRKLNWADQVKIWTDNSNRLADSTLALNYAPEVSKEKRNYKIYNTLATSRNELVQVSAAADLRNPAVYDASGKEIAGQLITSEGSARKLLFKANVPAIGFSSYTLKEASRSLSVPKAAGMVKVEDGKYHIQTDLYDILINPEKGGTIAGLTAKKAGNKQMVNKSVADRYFNEMRGYFYTDSTWHSSADQAAQVSIIENGPLRVKIKIEGHIAEHPFTQYITLVQGEEKIDFQTKVDWKGNPGIGQDYHQKDKWKAEDLKKAFYNDQYKLSALFPLNLKRQKVYKNAAFDVLQSKLENTYFNTWDSIKNNLILNWVDVTQQDDEVGMCLLNDHTSSYSHGQDGVLGLNLQYSGMGLWGRNYSITGPSVYTYALLPHLKKWDQADLWTQSLKWNEPLQVQEEQPGFSATASLLSLSAPGYEVSSLQTGNKTLTFRMFNASGRSKPITVSLAVPNISSAELTELNGSKLQSLPLKKLNNGRQMFIITIPEFGIRTIKLHL